MVNLNKLNKFEIGEILIPDKIYKLNYKKDLEKLYEKLYFTNINYLVFTNFFFISVILSLILYIFTYNYIYEFFGSYINMNFIYKFIIIYLTYLIYNYIVYYILVLGFFFHHHSIFRKKEEEIEKDLPEFIDNLVSNLKGGISLEKALLKSVRADQIALLSEITLINEKIMMGMNVMESLKEFRLRFDSQIISRTFFLIEEGIKGGGNLANPLEKISENLKKIYLLNDEIKSNAGGFSVVIKMIAIGVAPVLFALARTLLGFIGDLFGLLSKSGEFISVSGVPIEFGEYLKVFSYSMIVLVTFFASLITAQLKNEPTFEAIKYVPISLFFAILIHYLTYMFFQSFFNGILQ